MPTSALTATEYLIDRLADVLYGPYSIIIPDKNFFIPETKKKMKNVRFV